MTNKFRPVLNALEADIIARALHDRYQRLCKCPDDQNIIRNCAWHWKPQGRRSLVDLYNRFIERRRGRLSGEKVLLNNGAADIRRPL